MPQVAYHPLGGLEDLELGLRSLLQSQLMAVPAFKDMYEAIQRHHRDVKLAHLTGKARDLQAKAVRDTKFYNILMKMLCEVAGKQTRDQRQGLQQVHTWYLTNTHVLLCGPHFGKQYKQAEAKEILRRATTAKQPVHIKSAHGQELSQDIAPCLPDSLSADDLQDLLHAWKDPASSAGPPEDSDIGQSLGSLQLDNESPVDHTPCARAETNSPELGDSTSTDQFNTRSAAASPGPGVTSTDDLDVSDDEPATISPPRILMRPKTAISVGLSLEKQSGNLPQAVTDIRNVLHPIASLVNPHSTVPRLLSNVETDLERKAEAGRRAVSAKPCRSQSLQAWQTFHKKRSYGQDVVNKLNFVGRSGTGLCIRYSAHDLGESPEAHTHDFLKLYANDTRSSSNHAGAEGNLFVHQRLEDFYQTVENMTSLSSNSHRTSHMTRAKSAPADKTRTSREAPAGGSQQARPPPTTDIHLEPPQDSRCEQQQVFPADSDTGVSLDRVISVIDAVTDSLVYYKEKLAPEPQLGFRQPSSTGLLSSRELVSSCSNVSMDSVCGMSAGIHQLENITTRPFSSSLAYGTAVRRDDMPEKHKETKIRCVSAGVVDWRGRITPESVRYKWSKTHCGGHTYVKKWHQPKSRSAGSTSAGRRPKTAPMTPKERWRTETDSSRAVQATGHTATLVDPTDVQHVMQVKHLRSSEHRTDQVDSLSVDGLTWRKLIRNPTQPPAMEYLSFVAPSGTAEQQLEKCAAYRGKAEVRAQTGHISCVNIWEQAPMVEVNIHVPHDGFDENALNVAVREELAGPRRNHSRQSAAAEVERSAGRMPGQSHSVTFPDQRRRSANIKVPPLCTPASIPNPRVKLDKATPSQAPLLFELERHARSTTSAAHCMSKVEALRSGPCVQAPAAARSVTTDSFVGTSLHISRLPATSRDKPRVATRAGQLTGLQQLGEQKLHTDTPAACTGPQHSATALLPQSSPGPRSISKIGRPVAEVFQTPDPDGVLQAVQLRRQAAAAVDIQRIFRGYVTRRIYKSLLSEERHKREDARRAAVRIQRMYRSHLLRKRAIYSRPALDPEVVQWSQDVTQLQSEHLAQRQAKLASWATERGSSQRQTRQKLAVIGPHVEVYSAYHPKRVGPSRHQLNAAAVNIQKVVRGWLLRRKLEKLSRKAACHGSSFQKLARDYKAMLKRVQQQHGVGRPQMPFSIQCFDEYMDLKRRYEGIFENKCFEGELDPASLPAFFRECGLYPSLSEVEQALDVTLQGYARHKPDRGLTKREVLDMIFYIYVPPAAGLGSTRRSTWMNPIIDGQEARQLLGSRCVQAAPLGPCMQLVFEAKQAQRQREQDHMEEVKRERIVEAELRTRNKNGASDVVKVDTDKNGASDVVKVDTDKNGASDVVKVDTDKNGASDVVKVDTDKNGASDVVKVDTDKNGATDVVKVDTDKNGASDVVKVDTDKNGASDVVKVDTDKNIDEDKQTSRKSKTVTVQECDNVYH